MTINKELVKQWVEALRSDKYEQGKKALRSKDDKFCCLGVLCDISKTHLNIDWEPEEEREDFKIYVMDKNGGVLPDKVWEYLGKEAVDYKVQITTTNSKIPTFITESYPFSLIYLITLNDRYKLSFSEIADIIEEEFLLSGTINENPTTDLA